MGKKMMKLPSLFKTKEPTAMLPLPDIPWQWPSCNHPKTVSFRAGHENMFKTVNSVFFDSIINQGVVETPDYSWFTNSSSEESMSSFTTDYSEDYYYESLETVVRGARSERRLFFEPEDTSSILDKAKSGGEGEMNNNIPFKESVVLAMMESEDPYKDFRRSMEEMVECNEGMKDWECLEDLLGWYLRVNKKKNHGFIVAAFVDLLLVHLAGSSDYNNSCHNNNYYSTSFSSAVSWFSSPVSCSFQGQIEVGEEEETITQCTLAS